MEADLGYIQDFYEMITKLDIIASPSTVHFVELCDPEFNALKTMLNEAVDSRDASIRSYYPLLTATMLTVR